jgi:hypothetical protein
MGAQQVQHDELARLRVHQGFFQAIQQLAAQARFKRATGVTKCPRGSSRQIIAIPELARILGEAAKHGPG